MPWLSTPHATLARPSLGWRHVRGDVWRTTGSPVGGGLCCLLLAHTPRDHWCPRPPLSSRPLSLTLPLDLSYGSFMLDSLIDTDASDIIIWECGSLDIVSVSRHCFSFSTLFQFLDIISVSDHFSRGSQLYTTPLVSYTRRDAHQHRVLVGGWCFAIRC